MPRVWFITGSSRGLGRAIAEVMLEQGDQVVATARRVEQLDDLKQRYADQVLTLALDVKDYDQAKAAVAAAIERFGRIDVLVNNAGYGNIAAFEQTTEAEFRDQIDTVLWGVIHVTRAALPVMRQQRSGHIIQISSSGGRFGTPGLTAYQTAKWGVGGFSEALVHEVAPLGIKVSIIEPGAMATDWAGSSMSITPPNADYHDVIAPLLAMRESIGTNASYGSDIRKVALALRQIVEEAQPPLHLIMGSAAFEMVTASEQARLAEANKWKQLTEWVDVSAM